MTARNLIQLLEALPPNTRIPVEPSVLSTLKGRVQNNGPPKSNVEHNANSKASRVPISQKRLPRSLMT
jgi:hypothetical protein